MGRRASRDLKPLSQVAIIDEPILQQIVAEVVPLVNQGSDGGSVLLSETYNKDANDSILICSQYNPD
jgi:hypothetical protein